MNWTKMWEEGVDLDEEFDPFEPIDSGSCQTEDESVYFEQSQERETNEENE